MYCTHCNHDNPTGTKFCEACGKPLVVPYYPPPPPPPPNPGGKTMLVGWMTIFAGGMILLGFFLPWFTINYLGFNGRFSGFTALIAGVVALFGALLGTGAGVSNFDSGVMLGGGLMLVVVIIFIGFIVLSPVMGFKILQKGLRWVKSTDINDAIQKESARMLYRLAIIGGIPLICYLSVSVLTVSSFNFLGLIQMESMSAGFWMTLVGFIITIVAGAII